MWPELAPRVMADFAGKPLEELAGRVRELAAVARHFDGTLSIHSGSGKQAEVLESDRQGRRRAASITKSPASCSCSCSMCCAEQPAGSPGGRCTSAWWTAPTSSPRTGAFGAESELAATVSRDGPRHLSGRRRAGRVDGNLFLVFWLGNVVGSRDIERARRRSPLLQGEAG